MIPLLPTDEAIRRGKEVGLDDRFSSLNAFRVMLHNSRAAGAVADLLRTLMFHNKLSARPGARVGDFTQWLADEVRVGVLSAREGLTRSQNER